MSDPTDEKIAALRAASEAVERARVACEAAGASGVVVIGQLTIAHTFADITKGLDAAAASAERQRPDIKIGDPVKVLHRWRKGLSSTSTLEKVGRVWVRAGRTEFNRDYGRDRDPSNYEIDPDDLARINRCFPRKAGAK